MALFLFFLFVTTASAEKPWVTSSELLKRLAEAPIELWPDYASSRLLWLDPACRTEEVIIVTVHVDKKGSATADLRPSKMLYNNGGRLWPSLQALLSRTKFVAVLRGRKKDFNRQEAISFKGNVRVVCKALSP